MIHVLTCLAAELEREMLPHFAAYYAALGVPRARIHVILNAPDAASPALGAAEAAVRAEGLAPPRRWTATYTSEAMWAERRALQAEVARPGEWVLNADIDEHHVYPAPLEEVVAHCRRWGVTAVQGPMIDRIAPGGALAEVRAAPALAEQFPLRADLMIALFGRVRGQGLGGTLKLMLHRAEVRPARGGHRALEEDRPRYLMGAPLAEVAAMEDPAARLGWPFRVDHYKWTAGRLGKQRMRLSVPGVPGDGPVNGARIAGYLEAEGRIRLEDAALAEGAAPGGAGWRRAAFGARLRARLPGLRP